MYNPCKQFSLIFSEEKTMEIKPTDLDWSDYHKGLSPERERRLDEVIDGIMEGLLDILKKHNEGHGINATVKKGIFAVGLMGDSRIYAPVVQLYYDEFPGYDHLRMMMSSVVNNLPVARVIYCATHRVISTETRQFIVPN